MGEYRRRAPVYQPCDERCVCNRILVLFSLGETDQSLPEHTPQITTLRTLFTRYLDFNAVPRRSFFELLRWFATDDMEREKLDEFVSNEGAVGHLWRPMFAD